MTKRKTAIIYESFYDAVCDLGDTDFVTMMKAYCSYALNGEQPQLEGVLQSMWKLIRPIVDRNTQLYENGTKGGRPKNQPSTNPKPVTSQGAQEQNQEDALVGNAENQSAAEVTQPQNQSAAEVAQPQNQSAAEVTQPQNQSARKVKPTPSNEKDEEKDLDKEKDSDPKSLSGASLKEEERQKKLIFQYFFFDLKLKNAVAESRRFMDFYIDHYTRWNDMQLMAKLRLWEVRSPNPTNFGREFWTIWSALFKLCLQKNLLTDYTAFAEVKSAVFSSYDNKVAVACSPRMRTFLQSCGQIKELWDKGILHIGLKAVDW